MTKIALNQQSSKATPRHLAPDEKLELIKRVADLSRAGMTVPAIAKLLRYNKHTIKGYVKNLREAGEIPPHKDCVNRKPAPYQAMRKARLRNRNINTGSFAVMMANLSDSQINWLHEITPKGATVAHTLASIVRDAHAEECQV